MNVTRFRRERGIHGCAALTEAVLLHAAVKVGLRTARYSRLRAWLERFARIPSRTHSSVPLITWAVRATGGRISGTTCLAQALVMHTMLLRHGHEPTLRIGVRRSERASVEAHAWVECNGAVVMGQLPEMAAYAVLS